VNEVVKLDFASGIRSMMRQDPDVILVGEVRDQETAEMAFRAAMTGHQVYSTLHTNSSIGAIPRLMDLGVLPDIMAGNIIGVIAQRLVRKLCAHCKAPTSRTRRRGPAGMERATSARLPGGGVRALRASRLPRARGDHGALQARRGDRRAHRAARDRARDQDGRRGARLPHARRRRHRGACSRGRPASRRSRAWST
jgi:type II secretory ATPase GspE/PulE/Tfp pilus assembly ATPase PilB-like protein